jgi:hypothetical protein
VKFPHTNLLRFLINYKSLKSEKQGGSDGYIKMEDIKGDFQGGSIEVITRDEVEFWKNKIQEVLK